MTGAQRVFTFYVLFIVVKSDVLVLMKIFIIEHPSIYFSRVKNCFRFIFFYFFYLELLLYDTTVTFFFLFFHSVFVRVLSVPFLHVGSGWRIPCSPPPVCGSSGFGHITLRVQKSWKQIFSFFFGKIDIFLFRRLDSRANRSS